MLSDWLYRLRALFRREAMEGELEEELRFHFERQVEKYVQAGADRAEAVRRVRSSFGGMEQVKEHCRDARGVFALESLIQDLRYALRMWGNNPGFALAAVTAIGLGIGVNAAVFTLANAALLRSLPFDQGGHIVYVQGAKAGCESPCDIGRSYPDYREFRAQAKSFEGLAAYCFITGSVSDRSGLPERFRAWLMSANGFSVLGWKPVIGRDFVSTDERPGAAAVVLLAYSLWETRYGKDPSIVGKTIRVDGTPAVVIGVMPREVPLPGLELWMPLVPTGEWERRERDLFLFGRLASGTTLGKARAEMETISRRLESAYPAANQGIGIRVQDARHHFFNQRWRLVFLALWWAVGFVLLVACANVANLLLARAVGRSREISIRIALGAARWRVMRQLLVESVALSAAGGLAGWLLATCGVRAFEAAIPEGKPAWLDFTTIDYTVFGYLAAISIGAGILFGLAPALRLSKLDVNAALKDGGQGTSGGSRGRYLAGLLVVSEMALTVVLLVGAAGMIRMFLSIYRSQIGVDTSNVLTMRLDLPENKYAQPRDQISFYQRLEARLRTVPGVEAVFVTSGLPGHGADTFLYELEGAPPAEQQRPRVEGLAIGAGYFRAFKVRPLVGREFTESDGVTGVPVVMVNQRFAAKFWPEGSPVGRRLRLIESGKARSWLTVVGVAPDILQSRTGRGEFDPLIYLPYREQPQPSMDVAARTQVPPAMLGTAFRRAVQAIDEDLPVYALRTLEEDLWLRDWGIRVFGTMFAIFAAIALALASVGMYAVMAHAVNQRTQEIGVRVAMGASGADIIGLVIVRGIRQLATGLALGLAAAFVLTRLLGATLAGIGPADALTFVTVAVVLTLAGGLACAIPARRALRVDPVVALRCE